ncbi:MFS transporter [Amycolatopsis sp. H20-H5]|uniref:MFS transporter n=1 Tax=Amycolatopsis sp. H20-H5 TaxID=3046309 RepID=UPI002DBB0CCD|nr:MFS transporter [Amycolatopsis sp. H20-H5]MEC3981023.1 MFS transporter [Amycolatopsis sp. H20-H5]
MVGSGVGTTGVFGQAQFRILWAAAVTSIVGDQLARVALSLLVFARTGSAAATAGTYALTTIPALVSGVLLSGLADRWPRRSVMVTADAVRAVLVAAMAIPDVPLGVLAGLLVLVQLAEAPFAAAQGAVLPDMLDGRYEAGQTVMLITHQTCLVGGFAGGGLLATWLGPNVALAVDAATFVVSGALLRAGIGRYPVEAVAAAVRLRVELVGWLVRVGRGAGLVARDRRLRTLMSLGWLATFTVVPEGLAVVFATQAGLGTGWVGVLLAAEPAGAVAGAVLLRLVPRTVRLRLLGVLAVGTSLPLLGYATAPGVAGALVLLVVSGLCSAYQVSAASTFVQLVPADRRGQALGFARAGLIAGQGIGVAAGGVIAQACGSATIAIALAGVAGTALALAAATGWARLAPAQIANALPVER